MKIAEAAAWLQTCEQAIILIHQSPDGDCIGSGYALAALLRLMGKHAVVRCSDPIPARYAFLLDDSDTVDESIAAVISVDVADRKLLGDLDAVYGDHVQLAIDHHMIHRAFAAACCLYPQAAATCEIVYAIAKELPVVMTEHIAACLYTGIATDTGCFQFDNVTPNTLRAAANLMEQFPDVRYAQINRAMFAVKSMGRLHLEQKLTNQMRSYFHGKCIVICITLAFLQTYEIDQAELDGLANFPLQVEGAEVGITLKEREPNVFKISMRSSDRVDVAAICKQFGGGGHIKAAGCLIEGTAEEVIQKLTDAVERSLAAQ
ncbi:MAG: bifunctional oligoribonuclease/PAP phosphatase NrnA [Ruminococcus callidus]|nr:bifunctional oligoribonuclease/PAP phosphatase NrnA [Ruminococcus callidus]